MPYDPYSAGLSLTQSYLEHRGRKASFESQARTLGTSAAATSAEADDARLAAEFEVGRIREAGVRTLAQIEADFADLGQDLDVQTQEALIDAMTEIELSALMRLREGRFEESQLDLEAESLKSQSRDFGKASDRKFLGLF